MVKFETRDGYLSGERGVPSSPGENKRKEQKPSEDDNINTEPSADLMKRGREDSCVTKFRDTFNNLIIINIIILRVMDSLTKQHQSVKHNVYQRHKR